MSNPTPSAGDDTFSTPQDTALVAVVTANDSDPDGDALSYTLDTGASNGTASIDSAGQFTYTPNAGYTGPDSFTYTVTDADGASTTATVNLTVTAAGNAPPTLADADCRPAAARTRRTSPARNELDVSSQLRRP